MSYRTTEDKLLAEKKNADMYSAIHTILVLLGYADFDMDSGDYNFSFPTNTACFLETMKEGLKKKGITILCNVNNDTYISLNQSTYDSLIIEMIDFIKFKIESAFSRNIISSVPDCVTEDGSVFLHPHTEIELKNGDILNFDLHYTPTALSDRATKN